MLNPRLCFLRRSPLCCRWPSRHRDRRKPELTKCALPKHLSLARVGPTTPTHSRLSWHSIDVPSKSSRMSSAINGPTYSTVRGINHRWKRAVLSTISFA